jgi:hypothetical protein
MTSTERFIGAPIGSEGFDTDTIVTVQQSNQGLCTIGFASYPSESHSPDRIGAEGGSARHGAGARSRPQKDGIAKQRIRLVVPNMPWSAGIVVSLPTRDDRPTGTA